MSYTEEISSSDSLLDHVDARTNLAGTNKMEILLFNLGTEEKFGINVFKVKEVSQAGKITRTPNMPRGVDGIVSLRGHVMPVLNLARFMSVNEATPHQTMMVAEYNTHILGFLVKEVDRIIRVDWDKVRPTEGMLSDKGALITAITNLDDGSLVSILDVEQILSDAFGEAIVGNVDKIEAGQDLCIFFADDSMVARRKISEVLDKMGVRHIQANNGQEAWERLRAMADAAQSSGQDLRDHI
ncbi:MAG: fused signal transduction protein/response regulator, partial [Gallionellaceae bacterium CG1_02_56_997]